MAILVTGKELVIGQVPDTHIQMFSQLAHAQGIATRMHALVSDDEDAIVHGLQYLFMHNDAVLITGGLGPTQDDRTRFALSTFLKQPLISHPEAMQHIRDRLGRFDLPFSDGNAQQALFPGQAKLIVNPNGTACGCYLEHQGKWLFLLPGPPREARPLFEQVVLPTLCALGFSCPEKNQSWLTLGVAESILAESVQNLVQKTPNLPLTIGYRWSYPYVEVKTSCLETDCAKLEVAQCLQAIDQVLAPHTVSRQNLKASQQLKQAFSTATLPLFIEDRLTQGQFKHRFPESERCHYLQDAQTKPKRLLYPYLHAKGLTRWRQGLPPSGLDSVILCFQRDADTPIQTTTFHIIYRGPEVVDMAIEIMAWFLLKNLFSLR